MDDDGRKRKGKVTHFQGDDETRGEYKRKTWRVHILRRKREEKEYIRVERSSE